MPSSMHVVGFAIAAVCLVVLPAGQARAAAIDDTQAERRAQAAGTATEIASYLDIRPDGTIDFLLNSEVEGAPPGVTQSMALQLDRAREDFDERLVKVLKLVADGMPKQKLEEHDEASPLVPMGRVILRPDDKVPFASVIDVLDACARPDVRLWNVVFETRDAEGEKLQIPTPLSRGPVGATEAGEAVSFDVRITVQAVGAAQPRDDTPVARALVYTLAFPARPAGQGTVSTALAVSSPAALAVALQRAKAEFPAARVTLRSDAQASFGEAAEVLAVLAAADLAPIRFGAVEG